MLEDAVHDLCSDSPQQCSTFSSNSLVLRPYPILSIHETLGNKQLVCMWQILVSNACPMLIAFVDMKLLSLILKNKKKSRNETNQHLVV